MRRFHDREEAGRLLAEELGHYASEHPIVLALPRGGVPVASEIARALSAPLDVWVVRKIGVPWQPELGAGAVAEGGRVYLNEEIVEYAGITRAHLAELVKEKQREVEERVRLLRGDRPRPALRDRTVIVVDDGIATGGTVRAAIRSIRDQAPKAIVLAVPVAPLETVRMLSSEVDRVVCLRTPDDLDAIGLWYVDFRQVPDETVTDLLRERSLTIPAGTVDLAGDLAIPASARGLVIFAHGSGSSRWSSRNRFVAHELRKRGLGTLLFDLLTADEERRDAIDGHLRFDIPLLAERLGEVTAWVHRYGPMRELAIGYFGASTGAAAALIAAAERPEAIRAVVSRGGRPDLARDALRRVRAPTLLIVGGADTAVLELNRDALADIPGRKQLAIVPGATHLFEEPGALEEAARLAGDWFEEHLHAAARGAEVAAGAAP
jgi:putative phosphoribosyl transferase